jgi:hypothetical protein
MKTLPLQFGMGGHQTTGETQDEWLTPPEIIKALGAFSLDPCAPIFRPWPTADSHYTEADDGLAMKWEGRVWLNPPYNKTIGEWMRKMAEHGDGIALIFARTETEFWHRWVWPKADAIFFFKGRLHFYTVRGERAKANAGAPSVLIAYGLENVEAIERSGLRGKLVRLNTIATAR